MRCGIMVAALGMAMLPGSASMTPHPPGTDLQRQVADTERAFAKTMADRDHAAFASFLSDETIFFSGAKALRGKQQVADAWKRFYDGADPPFSWEPEVVRGAGFGNLGFDGPGAGSSRQAGRDVHVDLAAGSTRHVADHLRQGQPRLRLREPGPGRHGFVRRDIGRVTMLKVWGRTNSVNVQKVLWCCEELAIEYERIETAAPSASSTPVSPTQSQRPGADDRRRQVRSLGIHAIVRYLRRSTARASGPSCRMQAQADQ
jgi:ketosteroid isomerase-like protein